MAAISHVHHTNRPILTVVLTLPGRPGPPPETENEKVKEIAAYLRANCAAWLKYNYEEVYGEMSYKSTLDLG